jgi:hypothetical protein
VESTRLWGDVNDPPISRLLVPDLAGSLSPRYPALFFTHVSGPYLGGSIEKLKEILGHYSVVMTERYAHLRPDLFSAKDLATIDLDLNAGEPDPGPPGPENGHEMASPRRLPGRIQLKLRRKCRSRPLSRGRNTVGMGRFPVRLGATSERIPSRRRDWRRQVVPLARHRTADCVRRTCRRVNGTRKLIGHVLRKTDLEPRREADQPILVFHLPTGGTPAAHDG